MSKDDKKKLGVVKEEIKIEEPVCTKTELRDPMFVGVDPSFNGFAIVVLDKNANIIEQKLIKSDSKLLIEERILQLEKEFSFIPNIVCLHSVFIEGPSFSSDGAFVLQMGALHYYLRIFLHKKKTNYKIIAPGTLKKFITGTGNAKKELMLLNVYKKFGMEFSDNNLCDAYALSRYALEEYKNENLIRSV